LLFFVPVLGGIIITVVSSVVTVMGPIVGLRAPEQGRTMKIKENYHDYDEDY
jgi:hypothetical protein